MNQDFKFQKKYRLLKKSDFLNLKKESHFFSSGLLLAFYKRNESKETRIGFAISKKAGNAVKRNTIRRILRECFRVSDFKFTGIDVLIAVNARYLNRNVELDHTKLRNSFKKILSNLK